MTTPRDVVLLMLEHRFGARGNAARAGLTDFQQEAYRRILDILVVHRGAILADSVGLGKTHVARALIEDALHAGERVLVCAPSQLADHWKRHLHGLDGWRWLSHARASRGGLARSPAPDLVVVDEAHAFRNPRARRSVNLRTHCADARVLLLTATPVNNSLLDFLSLLRLFADDDAFRDAGVPDLTAAFRTRDAHAARRVAELVMVRRTREDIERTSTGPGFRARGKELRFPRCLPLQLLAYDLRATYPQLHELLDAVQQLGFPAHAISRRAAAPELMRLTLLKRLESSAAAFTASLQRYQDILDHFTGAARAGLLFDPATDTLLYARVQGTVQVPLERIALRPWPRRADRELAIENAARERAVIARICGTLRATDHCDAKLHALRELLDSSIDGHTVLIFTEFRETAEHLWQHLVSRGGVALIHGGDARLGRGRASRRSVVERFAPHANHVRPPRQHQRVRTLIATDVLAEGLNLQDASAIISYDVPWNPVRLAQRIGRIDRLGSPHPEVHSFAFRPERTVDEFLGLMRRVKSKLRAIRTVGGDAPRFRTQPPTRTAAEATDLDLIEKLRAEWKQRRHDRLPDAPAAALVRGPYAGAVCCVASGSATVFVLLPDGAPEIVGGPQADRILLSVVCDPAAATASDLSAERIDAIGVAALCAVRHRMETRATPAIAGTAASLRHWLATRPGGAGEEELREADVLLERLRTESDADGNVPVRGRRRTWNRRSDNSLRLIAILVLEPGETRVDPACGED